MELGLPCLGIGCAISVCNDRQSHSTILHESELSLTVSQSYHSHLGVVMEIPSVLYR